MAFLALIMVLFIWGEHPGVYEHDVHYGLVSNYIAELLVYTGMIGVNYTVDRVCMRAIASK